jgi:Tfp pilus assembly protein PilF
MDALKKAEQANQQGRTEAAPAAPAELALEAMASASNLPEGKQTHSSSSTPTSLPKLPRLEDLDAEFIAHARQPPASQRPAMSASSSATTSAPTVNPPPLAKSGEDATRQAVRNVFAVKQKPKTTLSIGLVAGVIGTLAAIAIVSYFWWQLRPASGPAVHQAPVATVSAPTPAPTPQPTAAAPASQPSTATPISDDSRAPPARRGASPPSRIREITPQSTMQPASPTQTPGSDPIRFAKSRSVQAPAAGEAYLAFQAGDLDRARATYQRLLTNDPRNIDALHGLAAIALREGRPDDAEQAYLRILEANPRDATANAGIIGLRNQGDPVASESRIKSLLAAQPDMPVLNFTLGNLYARQNRWSEAQQAYFQAYSGDTDNPDYLFNLAISLDQLHQGKLAAQYYRQALTAAEHRPAAFDRSQAINRLHDLAP